MCNAIGVDPLISSNTKKPGSGATGSFWTQMLGGSVNDFYFELAVRVVEVCRDTRAENGGMMAVDEVAQRVQKGRGIGGGMEVSEYADTLEHTFHAHELRVLLRLAMIFFEPCNHSRHSAPDSWL